VHRDEEGKAEKGQRKAKEKTHAQIRRMGHPTEKRAATDTLVGERLAAHLKSKGAPDPGGGARYKCNHKKERRHKAAAT
jgi:hypothetical protein